MPAASGRFRRDIATRRVRAWLAALVITSVSACTPDRDPGSRGDGARDGARERRNIVLFLIDDLGYRDVGAYNPDTFYETPNIDRLAQSGMRFTDGYAASPVCSPTRYSLMTGRYPSRVDATNFFAGRRVERFAPAPLRDHMPLEEVTVAEALAAAGYATFFAGKWHLGPDATYWPEAQGFDVNIGGHHRGSPPGPGRYFAPWDNPRLDSGPEGEFLTDRLADETAAFVRAHAGRPFFAMLSLYSVHIPLMAPPDLVAKYERKAREQIASAAGPDFLEEEQVWPTEEPRRVRAVQSHPVYAAMVEAMDRAVGSVLDTLEETGLADDTAIFFVSDNGGLSTAEGSPTSNLPLRGGKGWLYEGGIREPFLARVPGVTQPGSVSSTPVITTDLYPTILELAGLPLRPSRHLDGVSLLPVLSGGAAPDRDVLFWHYPHYSNQGGFPGGAIRTGRWKLLERYEDGRVHLYDLEDDLGERTDLASREPERVDAMRATLHAWYREVDAKFLAARDGGPAPWTP